MSGENSDHDQDNTQEENSQSGSTGDTQPLGAPSNDPLRIIGWEIGGKYKVRSYIGGGGFGEVYDAYNKNLPEQRLVIKFFKRVQARDRFDREAKILCLLDHPNISNVVDYLPAEGALVIQYIDGKDGAVMLKESGPLPAEMLLKVARRISDAIAYAHTKKIAHRDIKPHNILVDRNGHVYLIDFGIAKEVGGEATRTGYQALTPMFAAPERQTGEQGYNPFLSDVYELGITLFNFATNSLPYRNPVAPDYGEWGGNASDTLSPQFRKVLKKATHPDPAKRYTDARAFADDLKQVETVYAVKRKKPAALFAGLAVIAAAAVLAVLFWPRGGEIGSPVDKEAAISPGTMQAEQDASEAAADTATIVGSVQTPPEETQPQQETGQDNATSAEPEPAESEATPPPPPPPEMRIAVRPAGVEQVRVDREIVQPGRLFETTPGSHEIVIIHPDYPVFRTSARAGEGRTNLSYDLAEQFGELDTINVQVSLVPPTDQYLLEISFNGRTRRYTDFPVLDLNLLAGSWGIQADIQPINREADPALTIDSCVVHPFGTGPRDKTGGGRGVIRLGAGETGALVPLLVFWSK